MKHLFYSALTGIAMLCMPFADLRGQGFTENFDDITLLAGNGWFLQNNSAPVGITNWFQGTSVAGGGPFDSYNGAANAYISANFNNTTGGSGIISTWMLTPNRTFRNGDVLTFYTRKPATPAGGTDYPDRLEVRLSTNGASTNVGAAGNNVGDFTTLLLSVNPTLVAGGYPFVWTQYTITLSGLPAPTSGRIAFRYFVTGAGPTGTNSDYIGIDNVVYTPYVCPAFTVSPASVPNGTAGSMYSQNLSQTGALGAPNYAITAGALPPGLTLSAAGVISGTPTATGTFNFTVTVNDNSGCSGSRAYSITTVCPANPTSLNGLPALCSNNAPYTLVEGLPGGGTYSGTGVSGGQFDPASGTQTITYDYTDPYGCSHSTSAAITVNTAPVVGFTAPAAACSNGTPFAITGGTPAGGTYSGTGVSGGQFDPASGTQTITYDYTDANGCSDNATATITVNAAPSVSFTAPAPVCADAAPFAITGGAPAGGTYSGTGVSGGQFNPASGTQTVTYNYTDANGCSGSSFADIVVNALPVVDLGADITSPNASVTITAPAGFASYLWNTSATTQSITVTTSGTYSVTVTDNNGCSASDAVNFISTFSVDNADGSKGLTRIFPNPASSVLNVVFEGINTSEIKVEMLNLTGAVLFSEMVYPSAGNATRSYDMSAYAEGIYMLRFTHDNITRTQRVVLKK
ncbi:MAG: choice-of-anchor J domain-containing protein [Flavobacteriales bacterium]